MKKTNAPTKPTALSPAMLVFKKTDKKQIKPLFSFKQKQMALWKCQNDMTCQILYGCAIKQLPRKLRVIVTRVLNDRHRQHEKGEQALRDVAVEFYKRVTPKWPTPL